jgi:hypothetical protein
LALPEKSRKLKLPSHYLPMEAATILPGVLPERTTRTNQGALPWYCLAAVLGATCIPIGALWDISWHSTIGRDTFWTPAHLTIHAGGLIPGFTAGWLALCATFFRKEQDRSTAVRLGPFYAPLGAWVIIWGALAMLFSAPFDNWWHNAYGLDVEILSPPHTVLAAGMYAVALGSFLLVLSHQNRTGDRAGSLLFIHAAGVLLVMSTIIVTEKSYPNQQHGSFFYQVSAAIYPLYLVIASRASKLRWGATGAALVYMGIVALMVWILPLFRAEPRLAPIYNPVTHMVPPSFPLLLVVPAFFIDLLTHAFRSRPGYWNDWVLAFLLGCAFLGSFLAAQYFFSELLISPAADNWFFAGNHWWPYFIKPTEYRFRFWNPIKDPLTLGGLSIALALCVVKSRIALAFAKWMARVQR